MEHILCLPLLERIWVFLFQCFHFPASILRYRPGPFLYHPSAFDRLSASEHLHQILKGQQIK